MTRHVTRLLLSAALTLASASCRGGDSKNDALARDTALARDLRKVAPDTSQFSEAADIAMATMPDSAIAPMPRVSHAPMRVGSTPLPGAAQTPMRTQAAPSGSSVMSARTTQMRVPSTFRPPTTPMPDSTTQMRAPTAAGRAPTSTNESPSRASASDGCSSPALADQRRCLLSYLGRSDAGLNRTYQAVIAELKRAAGVSTGEREPDTVRHLREAQRAWLEYRDSECRRRNRGQEGPLWAPTRATCLGEFSGRREQELAATLAQLQRR